MKSLLMFAIAMGCAPASNDAVSAPYGPTAACGKRVVSPHLARWPYVQDVTPHDAWVRWGTDPQPAPKTVLRWGPDLQHVAPITTRLIPGDGAQIALHEAHLQGLHAGSEICYAIDVDGKNVARGLSFRAAPATVDAAVNFTVLGDYGHGTALQAEVRDAMLPYARDAHLHLTVGDNAYSSGDWHEWQRNVFAYYGPLWSGAPIYPTPGNHDDNSSLGYEPYLTQFRLPESGVQRPHRGRYWSMDYGAVHVIGLDSQKSLKQLTPSDPTDNDMLDWLRADLSANDRPWTVVTWHHPPWSEDPERVGDPFVLVNLLPILEEHKVDIAFMGHDHFYVRYKAMRDGVIDASGVTYVMTGGGGGAPRVMRDTPDERVHVGASVNQFMWVQVHDACHMTATSIDEKGETIDTFDLHKCR